MELLLATRAEGERWDAFVRAQEHASLGHLYEWRTVFERAYHKRGYYLAALRQGRWVGVLPLVHMKGALTGNRLVSLPFLDHAGPLGSDPEASSFLLNAAVDLVCRKKLNGFDIRSALVHDSEATSRATLILPLPEDRDALWDSFAPKVRNQIRKATRQGLQTKCVPAAKLDVFYRVFSRNMRDLGSPVHSRGFLHKVLDVFRREAQLYLTRGKNGAPVGGAIALRFRDSLTVPWASSLRRAFKDCPNHSLYWQMLSDAMEAGVRSFDFGRSREGSGTYAFKTQWGALPQPLEWSSYDCWGVRQKDWDLDPNHHNRLVRAWSHLPVAVANLIGPRIRRNLAN